MPEDEIKLFYKYLDKATNYFEFGSGGSTYQALIRDNIKSIYSIENHKPYYQELNDKLKNTSYNLKKLNYILINMKTKKNTTGHPSKDSKHEDLVKYSRYFRNLDKDIQSNIDLILIDGRFRSACLLNSFEFINDNTIIIFDDFYGKSPPREKYYNIVLDYFEIIEKIGRLVVLKKKNVEKPIDNIIIKYETEWM